MRSQDATTCMFLLRVSMGGTLKTLLDRDLGLEGARLGACP